MKVTGKIKPLRNNVFVTNMEFGIQRTGSGLYIPGDDGKTQGIHPRWGQVWAVGDDQKDVKVGDWILIEHGRWTRTVEYKDDNGDVIEIRMVDNDAIMISSDYKPSDINRGIA
jgi:co-chaperonin GroES (HSP10)